MTDTDLDRAVDRIREAATPTDRADRYAYCARRLEFRAGPESHTFYACVEHKPILDAGDVSCFFADARHQTYAVDPDDEIECDLCREG